MHYCRKDRAILLRNACLTASYKREKRNTNHFHFVEFRYVQKHVDVYVSSIYKYAYTYIRIYICVCIYILQILNVFRLFKIMYTHFYEVS